MEIENRHTLVCEEAEAKAKAVIDKNIKASLDSLKLIKYNTKEDCDKAIFRALELCKHANSKELCNEIFEFANYVKHEWWLLE